ncbi:ABC transporter permease subunit [Shinella sp. CPCC 101442]|uniref:amino acid ABC transporter permease n=1 Tax=Shinella sp. CPCC 101442 TaxID=2932265 RepID=UPI002152861F|nr:ABC transporter permease subunit [Shinella sp. CPCC 101442]MCR6500126.1 ABC transporter permease subunit [Shinella sp. CPCC 101442]
MSDRRVFRAVVPGPPRPGTFGKIRAWWGGWPLGQLAFLAVLALFGWLFVSNVLETMARIGILPGFGFLSSSANFEIGESAIAFRAGDTYLRAIAAGLVNTLKVSLLGCVLATILGVVIGVAGLSRNLLLAGLVRWFIEITRNTPLLLQLFFWMALAKALPAPRQAPALFETVFLTNRGVYIPSLSLEGGPFGLLAAIALAAALGSALLLLLRLAGRLTRRSGTAAITLSLTAILLLLVLSGTRPIVQAPALAGFNIRGGLNLSPEFAALLTGLVVKFSALIAEIVRAGIQSVGTGQWEAARALGLHDGQIIRLVVLPQALRVITPLTTSSYLDLTKDSSLAVAIGFPDLVSIINTTANTTGQSMEALIILIGTFLAINLALSALMNLYNNRVAMRGSTR